MFLVGRNSHQSCSEKQPEGTQTLLNFFSVTATGESQVHLSAEGFPLLWYLWDAVGRIGNAY